VEARRAAAGTDAQGRAVFVVVEAVRRLDVSRSLVSSTSPQAPHPLENRGARAWAAPCG
jgi:hypothetical protein